MRNVIEFQVYGRMALFTDPITKIGGERSSYAVPTYQALKGITESVYWKPTIFWIVDEVRVMNRIVTQARGVRPLNYGKGNDLAFYKYLSDVCYQVRAHFEFNLHRPDLAKDRNENKHHNMAKRMVERGGRRDIFLGTRECQGYVEPVKYGDGEGYYDGAGEMPLGTMLHGFDYPDETGEDLLRVRFWQPEMKGGVIRFLRPEECTLVRKIREAQGKRFTLEDIRLIEDEAAEWKGGVCLKRKIRNRLQDAGEKILVQSDDRTDDEFDCIRSRVEGNPETKKFMEMKVKKVQAQLEGFLSELPSLVSKKLRKCA